MAIKIKDTLIGTYNKIKFKNKDLVFLSLFIALIVLVDFFFILRPKVRTITKISKEVSAIKTGQTTVKQEYHIVKNLPKIVSGLKERADYLNSQILLDEERTMILGTIEKIANDHHIKILSITPHRTLKKKKSAKWKNFQFYPFGIKITAIGGYHQIAQLRQP